MVWLEAELAQVQCQTTGMEIKLKSPLSGDSQERWQISKVNTLHFKESISVRVFWVHDFPPKKLLVPASKVREIVTDKGALESGCDIKIKADIPGKDICCTKTSESESVS